MAAEEEQIGLQEVPSPVNLTPSSSCSLVSRYEASFLTIFQA